MDKKKRKLSTLTEDECLDQIKAKQPKTTLPQVESQPKIISKSSYFIHSTHDIKDTWAALNYLIDQFPSDHFAELPKQIFLHQIYSLIRNKTSVDRDIESYRKENKIILFKCDSKSYDENDLIICFYADFKQYVEKLLNSAITSAKSPTILNQSKSLINLFTDKILIEHNLSLSISKSLLIGKYQLSEKDLTNLIQFGLFNIKDSANFWFAMPNFGSFRRLVLESRKLILDSIKKKKYKEIEFEELDKRNSKNKVNKIGIVYVLHDLIGDGLISLMDVPNKSVFFKLN